MSYGVTQNANIWKNIFQLAIDIINISEKHKQEVWLKWLRCMVSKHRQRQLNVIFFYISLVRKEVASTGDMGIVVVLLSSWYFVWYFIYEVYLRFQEECDNLNFWQVLNFIFWELPHGLRLNPYYLIEFLVVAIQIIGKCYMQPEEGRFDKCCEKVYNRSSWGKRNGCNITCH